MLLICAIAENGAAGYPPEGPPSKTIGTLSLLNMTEEEYLAKSKGKIIALQYLVEQGAYNSASETFEIKIMEECTMKITTFNPSIITKDAATVIALFEELGFQQTHNKAENVDIDFSAHRMKNEGGFHVDVVEVPTIPRTYTAIRINVDNFEEAYDFFMSKGFRESKFAPPSTTASSKYAYLVSSNGVIIDVCEHIKKKDQ